MPRRIAVAVLFLGYAVMLAMNAPGQLSYDSVEQLAQGRAGSYNSWHPPVMAWLLGLFDRLLPGTLLFLLFQSLLLLGALLILLSLKPRDWGSVAVSAAIVLLPQWLLYQGEIWKDILFADAAIAGFASLAWFGQNQRAGALVLATLLLGLAASTRQNGLVLLVVAAITLWLMRRRQRGSGWRQGFIFFIALLGLTAAIQLALAPQTDGGEGMQAEIQLGQSYDLAGALARAPNLALPLSSHLKDVLSGPGARLYSPLRSDPFAASPVVNQALSQAPDGMIGHAWWWLLKNHPLLYLQTRGSVFAATLTTPDPLLCHLLQVGVSARPTLLKQLGMRPGVRPQDQALANYAKLFIATPVFSHLAWGGLAMILLVILLRRGTASDLAVAGLLAGALLFSLSFALISIACDYRYLIFLDLSAMAGSLYAVPKCGFFLRLWSMFLQRFSFPRPN
jgi:hypothetical protein